MSPRASTFNGALAPRRAARDLPSVLALIGAILLVLSPRAASADPITNPNDPRNWQGATLETFRVLLGFATLQDLVNANILDDGIFPHTAAYADTFTLPGAPCGAFPANIAAPTYIGQVQGCSGYSYDPGSYAYNCGGASLADYAERGRCLDMWFLQDNGDGDVTTGNVWDLGGQSNQVAVFPIIDHGPLPGESIEYSVYLSNDPVATQIGNDGNTQWVFAQLDKVYLEGWHRGWIADGFTTVWRLPGGQTFRYANVVAGGPGALLRDGDDEIDTVIGLSVQGDPVCSRPECNDPSPTIISLPALTGETSVEYQYDLRAIEPGTHTLRFFLLENPIGMTIDAVTGAIRWTPTEGQAGSHRVEVQVRDERGKSADQRYYISVRRPGDPGDDLEPPSVTLLFVVGGQALIGDEVAIALGTTVEFRVEATDNLGVTEKLLLLANDPVPLDGSGRATRTMGTIGLFDVLAIARDAAGNADSSARRLRVYDPADQHFPTVEIHSPGNDSLLSRPRDVVVTISDVVLESYTVDFARLDQVDVDHLEVPNAAWINLARGTSSVDNSTVGVFDPTILLNDDYVIRAVGRNVNGRVQTRGVIVHVYSELKLGEFRIEFTDLAIPVAGIPIEVKRVYDSRQSTDSRDFGFGWSLGIQDARILEGLRAFTTGRLAGQKTLYPGARVYTNTPDGRRVGFTAYTKTLSCSFFGCIAYVAFRADPGVHDSLDLADGNEFTFEPNGGYYGTGLLGSEPVDPENYRLILKDGTAYEYSQTLGLRGVADLNGNRLEYTPGGIVHYLAGAGAPDQQVSFIRDAQGRIVRIVDPAGNPLLYAYDAAGDLRSFTNQVGNLSQFTYHAARPHYLATIIDPLGHQAVRTEFDDAGRIRSVTDALGNVVRQDFDLAQNIGTFTDARGYVTISEYDDQGNVVKTTDPEGGITEFRFDASNNEIWKRDARGYVTEKQYDGNGNVTLIRDALSNETVMTYNALSKPTSIRDVLGHTTSFEYDAQGNLIRIVNARLDQSTIARDGQGRVSSVTDFNGHTTNYDHASGCPCGLPGRVTYADGTTRAFEYNGFGQVTREVDENGYETVSTYDQAGKLTSVRDAAGNTTSYDYEGPIKISERDPLGRVTVYTYDSGNRQSTITDNAGNVARFEYDSTGNRRAVVDPMLNRTEFWHDGMNRIVRQIDPLGNLTQYNYDAVGNLSRVIDRNGRQRRFEHDELNRRTLEQWFDGAGSLVRTLQYSFNALGLMTYASDPTSMINFHYDDLNRLQSTTQSNVSGLLDFTLTYTYDDAGSVTSVTDNYGAEVNSSYDNRNRIQARSWQGDGISGAMVRFANDAAGNRLTVDRYSDLAGIELVGHSEYRYNRMSAIVHIRHENGAGTTLAEFDYERDIAQQITRRVLNGQTTTYSYDAIGQLTGASYSDNQPDEVFNYDANGNRRMSGYSTGAGNRLLADGTHAFEYDAEGNIHRRTRISTGSTTTYEYDHRNRLIHAVDQTMTGTTVYELEIAYDALGHRLSSTLNGTKTHHLYDGEGVWADVTTAGMVRYLMGPDSDEMLARRGPASAVEWYVSDNLKSVQAVTDLTGNALTHVTYSAFGNVLGTTGSVGIDRFLFTGREFDAEFGLYYYRSRCYSPEIGRFVSEDAMRLKQDMNPYRYVLNSPLIARDPTGMVTIVEYAVNLAKSTAVAALWGAIACDVYLEYWVKKPGREPVQYIERYARYFVGGLFAGFVTGAFVRASAALTFVPLRPSQFASGIGTDVAALVVIGPSVFYSCE